MVNLPPERLPLARKKPALLILDAKLTWCFCAVQVVLDIITILTVIPEEIFKVLVFDFSKV